MLLLSTVVKHFHFYYHFIILVFWIKVNVNLTDPGICQNQLCIFIFEWPLVYPTVDFHKNIRTSLANSIKKGQFASVVSTFLDSVFQSWYNFGVRKTGLLGFRRFRR